MFRKILAAIDRSPNGKIVFEQALVLTKATGANLMLLHVLSSEEKDSPQMPSLTTREYSPLPGELLELYRKQWHTYEEQGLKLLRSLTEEAADVGVRNEFTQNSGSPGREICEVAQTWDADLIVIGRRGRSSLQEWIAGSASSYVFHHAPCAVHIVFESQDSKPEIPVTNQTQVAH